MARKIALTSTSPLSGKSTLAKYLEREHGFIRADHSLSLVRSFVQERNSYEDAPSINVQYVYKHKEAYRRDLQRHGDAVGFNDPAKSAYWVEYTLAEWYRHPEQDVVFDSFRGEVQAPALRNLGFTLVQLNIPGDELCRRAEAMGKDCDVIKHAMRMRPDLEGGIAEPDVTLMAVLPVAVLADLLLFPERHPIKSARKEASSVHTASARPRC